MHIDYNRVTLLCVENDSNSADWELIAQRAHVIRMPNWRWIPAAIETGIRDLGQEIDCVIFDGTITPVDLLDLLATLPGDFRGDVLAINVAGASFLSSSTPREGRIVYRLSDRDVDFYVEAHFGRSAFLRGSSRTSESLMPSPRQAVARRE